MPGPRSVVCVRRKMWAAPGTEPGDPHAQGKDTMHQAMGTSLVNDLMSGQNNNSLAKNYIPRRSHIINK